MPRSLLTALVVIFLYLSVSFVALHPAFFESSLGPDVYCTFNYGFVTLIVGAVFAGWGMIHGVLDAGREKGRRRMLSMVGLIFCAALIAFSLFGCYALYHLARAGSKFP